MIPFQTIDWSLVAREEHTGEQGSAWWQTIQAQDIRVRIVTYSAGYIADHWCRKGHIVHCLEGSFVTELDTGEQFSLSAGMTYIVSDDAGAHRSTSEQGVQLLIIDGAFLKPDTPPEESDEPEAIALLTQYPEPWSGRALDLRRWLLERLPGITEQVDMPARMVAYCYGQKYDELVCTIIPSQKGLKLGFNKGADLPDPAGLLQGSGKVSRYVVIKDIAVLQQPELDVLVAEALSAYEVRMKKGNK